ncbi:MAG: M24 family metallopeptidase [Kiritimatiellia bacterium]
MAEVNPYSARLAEFGDLLKRRRLDAAVLFGAANIRALTDVVCDNGCLVVSRDGVVFATDFRYIPMVRRVAPWLTVREQKRGVPFAAIVKGVGKGWTRVGYEGSVPTARYLALAKKFPAARFVDVEPDVLSLRAVKTVDEITRIAAAEALNDEIWERALADIRPGMAEKDIQRVIRAWMNALGDGEAFETIVCAGKNAAECHHVPDGTVWRKGEPLLVDMGVRLDGVCADMTRNIKAANDAEYGKIYRLVLEANRAAIAAARPGMTAGALDKVARDIIEKAGYGEAFGHSLGHGVGYEIHELPTARPQDGTVLEPGMFVTIEPGIYLEGRLGVRIEDLVLIITTGCEVLSHAAK